MMADVGSATTAKMEEPDNECLRDSELVGVCAFLFATC